MKTPEEIEAMRRDLLAAKHSTPPEARKGPKKRRSPGKASKGMETDMDALRAELEAPVGLTVARRTKHKEWVHTEYYYDNTRRSAGSDTRRIQ